MKELKIAFGTGMGYTGAGGPEQLSIAQSKVPEGFRLVLINPQESESERIEKLKDADFILGYTSLTKREFEAATKVKLIQSLSAGFDDIDLQMAAHFGIPVANNGGANSVATAEHTILLILAVYKKLPFHHDDTKNGGWLAHRFSSEMHELAGKTLGIIGIGSVGKEVAKRAKTFEATVQYYDKYRLPTAMEKEISVSYLPFVGLLKSSDIISLHVPLTPETRAMIGKKELGMMKQSAILINTSRGTVVNEQALYLALKEKRISGAGLDVFSPEPPKRDNPLFQLGNVVVTPHIAAGTIDTYARRLDNCFANIVRVARGQPPLWIVK